MAAGCIHNMWKDGGIKGLFKGNLATIMKVAPQTAVQFAVSSILPSLLFTVRTANFPQCSSRARKCMPGTISVPA